MKKLYFTLINVIFITVASFGQTGILEDFNDNSLDPGWEAVGSGWTLNETNQELEIISDATGAWDNLDFTFTAQDISQNPVIKLKIKSSDQFDVRLDLFDQSNVDNLADGEYVQGYTGSGDYEELVFDFSDRSGAADLSQVANIVIFISPGNSFNGTVYFEDLTIGDALPYLSSGPIRVNQVGYELNGPKQAVLEQSSNNPGTTEFEIIDQNLESVYTGTMGDVQQVNGWTGRYFSTIDFSDFTTPGTYQVRVGSMVSFPFEIRENLFFEETAEIMVDFFYGMRSDHEADYNLGFHGDRDDVVDVHGGWIDATGDPGKHMSHLSYANYFNPQQIPMVVYSLLKGYEMYPDGYSAKETDLFNEAAFGADYILKNIDPEGYMYLAIFDNWGNSPETREICEWGLDGIDSRRSANYQAAMREGAGIAIAALARAYNMNVINGDSTPQQYLAGAEKLYAHLKSPGDGYATKNLEYCNDHTENIIDDYCGLLAAIELYRATEDAQYLDDADARARSLIDRQQSEGWFAADDEGERPFFHAADEGMPVVALAELLDINPSWYPEVAAVLKKNLNWYLQITNEVSNPFNYIRQYHRPYIDGSYGTSTTGFFIPHNNETEYWWQGENARLASMSTAVLTSAKVLDTHYGIGSDSLSSLALSQLDWILGKNPFEVCMMYGFGHNNYIDYPVASAIPNINGGICNGITAMDGEESNLDWRPYADDSWENWRWTEQWLPHNAWYVMAVSSLGNIMNVQSERSAFDLTGLEVEPVSGALNISWTTALEVNSDYFEVQWSSDGENYSTLSTISASGYSGDTTEYSFDDNNFASGTNFYRIVMVDGNGNTTISPEEELIITASIEKEISSLVQVSPNPFTETIRIKGKENLEVSITDGRGNQIARYTAHNKEIQTGEHWAPGIYYITVKGKNRTQTTRVVKVK